MYMLMKILLLW